MWVIAEMDVRVWSVRMVVVFELYGKIVEL